MNTKDDKTKKNSRTQKVSPKTVHTNNINPNNKIIPKHALVFLNGSHSKLRTSKPSPNKNIENFRMPTYHKKKDNKINTTNHTYLNIKKDKHYDINNSNKKIPLKLSPSCNVSNSKKILHNKNNQHSMQKSSFNCPKNQSIKSNFIDLSNNKPYENDSKSNIRKTSLNNNSNKISKTNLKQSQNSSLFHSNKKEDSKSNINNSLSNRKNYTFNSKSKTNSSKKINQIHSKKDIKNIPNSISKDHQNQRNKNASKLTAKPSYNPLKQSINIINSANIKNKVGHSTMQILEQKLISSRTSCINTKTNCKSNTKSSDKLYSKNKIPICSVKQSNRSILLSLNNYNSKTSNIGTSKLKIIKYKINNSKEKNQIQHKKN